MTPLPEKMKILQVASHSGIRRGGAVQVYRLTRELVRRGHEVTCVFHAPKGRCSVDDAVTLKKIEESGAKLRLFDEESLISLFAFRKFLKQERFDVIHSHRDLALRYATFGAWGQWPRVFVTNRGTTYTLKRFTLSRWLFRQRGLHRVVAVADAVKDVLMESGGLAPEKVSVIYGSVDTETFDRDKIDAIEARRKLNIPPDAFVVGTVATYAPKKGYDVFFRAAAKVVEKWGNQVSGEVGNLNTLKPLTPSPLPEERGETTTLPSEPNVKSAFAQPLVFLAVGGGVEKKMKPLVAELGLNNQVIFAGHCEDVAGALSAMDIFVCASTKGEGLTGTLREAMAMHCPVISTDVSGNKEIVQDGVTGLLVPVGNAEKLSEAILRLSSSISLAQSMSESGFSLIQQKFTDPVRSEQIEELYREIAMKSDKV